MKDLIITKTRQKTELLIFSICLLLAFLLNVVAILIYDTEWSELWTQLLWVCLIGGMLYGLTVVVRLLFALIGSFKK